MAVTRVGIVGLSATKATVAVSLHTWAVVAHLPSFVQSPDYEIVAVCNSTAESSRRAIESHKLPSSTKAYDTVQELANDPNVDMVVISVNVGKHFALTEPALRAGKQVFVEWPLGASTQEAEKLTALAREKNVKTIVGVQARADPLIAKVRQIIDSGKLGKITSSSVLGATSAFPTRYWLDGAEFYLDLKSGGNLFHIFFGHFLDSFTQVLGGFDTVQSTLKTEFPEVPILDATGAEKSVVRKTAPEHILVQGTLKSGAIASIAYRWADLGEAIDDVGVRWIITGTDGEIEITTDQTQWQMSGPRKLKLKLKGASVEEIDFSNADEGFIKDVPVIGSNTGRVWNAFAKGDTSSYADFESALETHKLLDQILEKSGFKY